MFNCVNCGASLPDGANVCPYCKAVQANANNLYSHVPNTPHDTVLEESTAPPTARQQEYSFAAAPTDESSRFYYQQKLAESINDASTARALGTLSIICAIFAAFIFVCWICGALGIAKANSAMRFAQQTGNMQLYNDAERAKSLNKTGLIISGVVLCVAGLLILLAVMGAVFFGVKV